MVGHISQEPTLYGDKAIGGVALRGGWGHSLLSSLSGTKKTKGVSFAQQRETQDMQSILV